MARCWGTELKARHIRVNVVSPGTTPIEGSMKGMYELEQKQFIQSVSKGIPLGRVGTAGELGNAVVFLASDQSSYIIGINLTVDGGPVQVYAENI